MMLQELVTIHEMNNRNEPRIRLGLVFSHNEKWLGGTYYILNLIAALKNLPDHEKPFLILLISSENDKKSVEELNYPYIKFRLGEPPLSFVERVINKISRSITGKNFFEKRLKDKEIDYIFPSNHTFTLQLISAQKKVFWIPDFQEIHYPNFFPQEILDERKESHTLIAQGESKLIFSSKDAEKDFLRLFPKHNCKTGVVHFAVTLPSLKDISLENVMNKYHIDHPYFICSNQFWVHKNHITLLKATLLLKTELNQLFTVVLTGKEFDHRAPNYTEELKRFVSENNLENTVRFLGLIDRREQLVLMKNSMAIIQPSLFEGWSTVVEDAKNLNKFILLSDIPVLKEQLNYNCNFFKAEAPFDLSVKMKKIIESGTNVVQKDYNQNIKEFGLNFIKELKTD